jgi:hypothetical protein
LRLGDVGDHDGALYDPDEGRTDAELGAVRGAVEVEQRAVVQAYVQPASNQEAI